jgi:hypothetical protein
MVRASLVGVLAYKAHQPKLANNAMSTAIIFGFFAANEELTTHALSAARARDSDPVSHSDLG